MSSPPRLVPACAAALAFGLGLAAFAAAPARADEPREVRSFELFATKWMRQIAADAQQQREQQQRLRPAVKAPEAGVTYRTVSTDFSTQLKETHNAAAPFVGILTYMENTYRCEGAAAANCRLVQSAPVTEIFPFKDGRWQY
jgi:hypothetical protein